jgi:translation initiation factor 2 subunit 1
MLYHKSGLPEDDEIVFCQVTKVFSHAVFVNLIEYNSSGMIHISEIAPGRIRNIRDYVKVDKQIVCKVLKIDKEKGHIDLSLRRVNSNQRREKLDEIKAELKAEKIISNLSKNMKKDVKKLYEQITEKIFKDYSHLHLCFMEVVDGKVKLEDLGISKILAKNLEEVILEVFKPKKIKIEGIIKLQTYDPDGVKKIIKLLKSLEKFKDTLVYYKGGGNYNLEIEDFEYKNAEKVLESIKLKLEEFSKDKMSTASFDRK